MARGWESKAVESQIEDAESRKRVLHDLKTSHGFRFEKMLRASLQYLDAKIASLEYADPKDLFACAHGGLP